MRRVLIKSDLHIHTNESDGDFCPTKVVEMAAKNKLELISITDHDTINGLQEAISAAQKLNIEIIPGIEISSHFGSEIHILGYNIPFNNKDLQSEIKKLNSLRDARQRAIVEKLQALNINIDINEVIKIADGEVLGRMHIAKILVKKGYCNSTSQAFDIYLGANGKAYVKDMRVRPSEAVELITRFSGIAVIAHPGRCDLTLSEIETLACELKAVGLKGIECEYFSHTNAEKEKFRSLATKLSLASFGGSDFHRITSEGCLGNFFYPDEKVLEMLNIFSKTTKPI